MAEICWWLECLQQCVKFLNVDPLEEEKIKRNEGNVIYLIYYREVYVPRKRLIA